MSEQKPQTAIQTMEIIKNTPANQIAELEFVKHKFIQNYNVCNPGGMGDLIYARNLAHFKQALQGSSDLRATEPFSIYACLMTIAVNGYSVDPQDGEIYLIPRGGKMCLQKQAPAHIKRLQRTNQIKDAGQAILVYEGDEYEVSRGRVVKHIEKFKSDRIIAGYIIFTLPDGLERHITYRKSDWESWRQSSPQLNGSNWRFGSTDQPKPGFLKTKIVSHACNEKCWASGRTPATVEIFTDVEIENDDIDTDSPPVYTKQHVAASDIPPITQHEEIVDEEAAFANNGQKQKADGVVHDDESF